MAQGELAEHRQQICFVVDRELADRLNTVAKTFGMSRSQLVGRILEDYLPEEEAIALERVEKRKKIVEAAEKRRKKGK